MNEFWMGVLTPFILVGGLAIALGLAWALASVSRWAWGKMHIGLAMKVDLAKNPIRVFGDDDRREYEVAANKIRDALIESPRLYSIAGLGWRIALVRESRNDRQ